MSIVFIISFIFSALLMLVLIRSEKSRNQYFKGFPHVFKYVGVAIVLICLIMNSILEIKEIEYKKQIINFLIILGLLLVVFSQDKLPNLSFERLRLNTMFISVGCSLIIYQFSILFNLLDNKDLSNTYLSIVILFTYLFVYHFMKNSLSKKVRSNSEDSK